MRVFLLFLGLVFVSAYLITANGQSDAVKIPPPLVENVQPQALQKTQIKIHKIVSDEHIELLVELAKTPLEQQIGMMFREHVPENTGMLFLFDQAYERNFWMKNTLVSLDLLFIGENGLIHHIHSNAVPESLAHINSRGAALAVLEIGGGESKRLGISIGDKVLYPAFE